ncbi:MAG: hypothetical protein AAF351_03090 [Pseudomonadota bacterium]
MTKRIFIRLLPILLITVAAGFWFVDVQAGGAYAIRNLLPLVVLLSLATVTLWRGGGEWTGSGWRWALGTVGFAIPVLGLATYLHYAYSVNLNGLFDASDGPGDLFRFLPWYTMIAGGIGFAIGWVVGRNV